MEYVEGMDLRKYIKRKGTPMTIAETLTILGPIIEALSHVHQAGLVHRDISPDNIMVLPNGSAKLLDFGAARYVENADAEKERATSTQAILKHGFAPPEQYQSHGALGPWTDVYALCATMSYCLTGKVPPEAMSRVIENKAMSWSQVPGLTARQRSALEKGMALTPKDRFASARELWDKLGEKKKQPAPKKEAAKEAKPKKERKAKSGSTTDLLLLICAASLVLLIGIGFFSMERPSSENPVLREDDSEPAVETTSVAAEPPLEIASLLEFENAQLGETGSVAILSDHSAQELQWSSDDPEVATVSGDGTVTAVGYGMAVITVEYEGQSASCTVYVDRTPNAAFYYTENETGITILRCQGELPTDLIIPRKIDGKPVTAIGSSAFSSRYSLNSVIIPEGVTIIMEKAFYKCSRLMTVLLPESLTRVENHAFEECRYLQNIIFPENIESIGSYAFASCYSLTEIYIPESVTSIGHSAFHMFESHKLKKATISSTTLWGPDVFPSDCQIIYY